MEEKETLKNPIEYALRFRRDCTISDGKRDAKFEAPADVTAYENIDYAGLHNEMQLLDVYMPEVHGEKLPVIVNVHGGGWVYGTKETYRFYCMSLAQKGFAVVNFTYRLAPEYTCPAPFEDMNQVLIWMRSNSEIYHFDLENVLAVGDSAGAQLLATYCGMKLDEDLEKNIGINIQKDIEFNAIALNCGKYRVYKLENDKDDNIDLLMDCFLGTDRENDSKKRMLSPYLYVNPSFPPIYLMSCEGDFLDEEYFAMKDILDERKVTYEAHFYKSDREKLFHVFHCDIKKETARLCNDIECEFFRRYIKN